MWILILTIISSVISDVTQIPFEFVGVEIENCDGSDPATSSAPSKVIECTDSAKKAYNLGALTGVTIDSVTYDNKAAATKSSLCKKAPVQGLTNYEIDIKANVKSIIYKVNTDTKAILVNSASGNCFSDLDISETDIKSGYIQIETILCYDTTKVTILTKQKDKNDPITFPIEGSKTCFLGPLLMEPVEAEFTVQSSKFKAVLSAFPKKLCAPCSPTSTSITKPDSK